MTVVDNSALGDAAARAEPEGSGLQGLGPDVSGSVRRDDDGLCRLDLMVENVHCGGCIKKIERTLQAEPAVAEARLNFTTRRLRLRWQGEPALGSALVGRLEALGYPALPFDPEQLRSHDLDEEKALLRAMAVAGFAAGNIMLLSVSVWAGEVQGMGAMTRGLLHWVSALIALPTMIYAGRPFYRSAIGALRGGHMNMDVPISLAVMLTVAMSLFETARGGTHVYFESAVMLLFFLLIGRYLDRRARGRARSAAERLLALAGSAVTLVLPDGSRKVVPPEQVRIDDVVLVAAGERIAIDGKVLDGRSEVDNALITGESLPAAVQEGDAVYAGTVNLSAPLRLAVSAVGEGTLLAEIVRLMEVAEQRKARYVEVAERIARLYAPAVHILAAVAFLGWWFLGAAAWQEALLIAVAVLIITCPCALGLAVPAVQVLASGRLMRSGILLKSASALERLAGVDTIVFDKTGTLTLGRPDLTEAPFDDSEAMETAASLAASSHHPLARALVRAVPAATLAKGVQELPGRGLLLETLEGDLRLGSRDWCGVEAEEETEPASQSGPELWLRRPGLAPQRFAFEDALRPDAEQTITALRDRGYRILLLSGDRPAVVARVAEALGIEEAQASCRPDDKVAVLERLAQEVRKVAMVGDGLNDAPALAAALVSISPSSAADISQTTADAVFQGDRLAPVAELLAMAHRSERLVRQNFALSFAYNLITVPLAMAGFVTPLIAAVSMSASSLAVVGNALRLNLGSERSGGGTAR